MLHSPYGEQHKPYHRRQGENHQPVRPSVLQAEEVGEAYRRYTPEDQHGPEHSGDALLRCDQAHPPCVSHSLDLVEAFCVELLLSRCAWLKLLKVRADVVDDGPPCRSPSCLRHQGCFSLLHQGILLMDHLLGVGTGEFLDVRTFWLGKSMGQPEDL